MFQAFTPDVPKTEPELLLPQGLSFQVFSPFGIQAPEIVFEFFLDLFTGELVSPEGECVWYSEACEFREDILTMRLGEWQSDKCARLAHEYLALAYPNSSDISCDVFPKGATLAPGY